MHGVPRRAGRVPRGRGARRDRRRRGRRARVHPPRHRRRPRRAAAARAGASCAPRTARCPSPGPRCSRCCAAGRCGLERRRRRAGDADRRRDRRRRSAGAEPVPALRARGASATAPATACCADRPNLLRIVVGEPLAAVASDEVVVLEATIDDTSPQLYEHVLERLLAAGARDAFLEPVVMKKSRPGVTLRVLARPRRSRPARGDRLRRDVDDRAALDDRRGAWCCHARSDASRPRGARCASRWRARPTARVNVAPEYEDCRALALGERGAAQGRCTRPRWRPRCAGRRPGVTTPGAT